MEVRCGSKYSMITRPNLGMLKSCREQRINQGNLVSEVRGGSGHWQIKEEMEDLGKRLRSIIACIFKRHA